MVIEPSRCILLADEDPVIRTFLADNLTADGYTLLLADDRARALALLETHQPDLVICDVNGDTLSLLDAVRAADGVASRVDRDTPLMILTTRSDELTRLRFYERGGDDVIAKPFSYAELRARVRVLLARAYDRPAAGGLRIGPLTLDPVSRQVRRDGRVVRLTNVEFSLLRHLAAEPTRVFTKDELLRDVWGFRARGSTRTLDSHAYRLRRKLGPGFVVNVWGVGWRLIDAPPSQVGHGRRDDPAA